MTTMPTRLAALALLIAAGACTPIINQHGNLVEPEKLAELKPGVTTKPEVQRILGSPSALSTFGDRTWYYVSRRTAQVAFFAPRTEDQESVAVDFDERGTVSGVRQYDLRDGRAVEPVARQTPSVGKELGFFEQLVGNLGKFNTSRRSDAVNRGSI
ncbi:MAG: outer membrane protein assembly factor BamE [Alphaproteobacteria bacterium]|nr:outer membrane protein assembly factor BamE [Alphaproteobacteria bacterium]